MSDVSIDKRRRVAGLALGIGFMGCLLGQMFTPTAYLYQQPGLAIPVSGDYEGHTVIELTHTDAQIYESDTTLLMTTVSTLGNADYSVTGAAAVQALMDDNQDLIPVRALYTTETTAKDVRDYNLALMRSSQIDSIVAGYRAAGVEVPVTISVAGFTEGSYADGVLQEGDQITLMSYQGSFITPHSVIEMREFLENVEPGESVTVNYTRGSESLESEITTMERPAEDPGQGSLLGVQLITELAEGAPSADILVGDVGGPSAGQMFALEIYDKLTEGSLGGDNVIAGTGTIDVQGNIGPIGGIRHKMVGALESDAEYFLAPRSNCDEVTGYIPDGLEVFAVETLDESISILEQIAEGDYSDAPRCPGT